MSVFQQMACTLELSEENNSKKKLSVVINAHSDIDKLDPKKLSGILPNSKCSI